MHDEATPGLKYNNQRMYHTRLGRFVQRDPWMANPSRPSPGDGYPDGMNTYAGYHVMHGGLDPNGKSKCIWNVKVFMKIAYGNVLIGSGFGEAKLKAMGEDGNGCYYHINAETRFHPFQKGPGSAAIGVSVGYGVLKLHGELEDFEAVCEWPLESHSAIEAAIKGVDAWFAPTLLWAQIKVHNSPFGFKDKDIDISSTQNFIGAMIIAPKVGWDKKFKRWVTRLK